MVTTVETEVDPKTEVYTKAELDKLRERLRNRLSGILNPDPPAADREQDPPDWQIDVDFIIKFLRALKKIMTFLVEDRITDPPRRLLQRAMQEVLQTIDDVIRELGKIESDTDELYGQLKGEGLIGAPGLAKFGGFFDDITGHSVVAVLDSANNLLGSLLKVFPVLSPVKEMKDIIKQKVTYDADQGIITTLGLKVDRPLRY
jgi:hypothetical protein